MGNSSGKASLFQYGRGVAFSVCFQYMQVLCFLGRAAFLFPEHQKQPLPVPQQVRPSGQDVCARYYDHHRPYLALFLSIWTARYQFHLSGVFAMRLRVLDGIACTFYNKHCFDEGICMINAASSSTFFAQITRFPCVIVVIISVCPLTTSFV